MYIVLVHCPARTCTHIHEMWSIQFILFIFRIIGYGRHFTSTIQLMQHVLLVLSKLVFISYQQMFCKASTTSLSSNLDSVVNTVFVYRSPHYSIFLVLRVIATCSKLLEVTMGQIWLSEMGGEGGGKARSKERLRRKTTFKSHQHQPITPQPKER